MEGLSIVLYFSPAYPAERGLPLAKELVAVLRRRSPLFQPRFSSDVELRAADRNEAFETLFRSITLNQPWPGDKHGFEVSISLCAHLATDQMDNLHRVDQRSDQKLTERLALRIDRRATSSSARIAADLVCSASHRTGIFSNDSDGVAC
jgi:hypothetical protein